MVDLTVFNRPANSGTVFTGKQGNETLMIAMDATISETPVFQSEITTNPIESGSSIADHVIHSPDTITVVGIVTDTPVKLFGNALALLQQGLGALNRSRAAFELFETFKNESILLTVASKFKKYENMVITNFSPQVTKSTSGGLQCSITLQNVKLVSTDSVEIPRNNIKDDPPGTKDQAQSTNKLGKQVGAAVTDKVAEDVSVYYKGFRAIGVVP